MFDGSANYFATTLTFLPIHHQVEDTPEVVAAREEHLKLVAETIANQPPEEEAVAAVEAAQSIQYVAQPQAYVQQVAAPQVIVQAQPQVYAQQVVAQPQNIVSQPQIYAAAIDPQQYVVSQPQIYAAAIDPQQYVVSQPVVAQPYLVGQPVAVTEPVAPASNQFHAQDELGQYQYGYANEHSVKTEHKTADGVVRGSYRYPTYLSYWRLVI